MAQSRAGLGAEMGSFDKAAINACALGQNWSKSQEFSAEATGERTRSAQSDASFFDSDQAAHAFNLAACAAA